MPVIPHHLDFILSSSPPGFELNLDIRQDFELSSVSAKCQQSFTPKTPWQEVVVTADGGADDIVGDTAGSRHAETLQFCHSAENLRRISKWQEHYDDCSLTGGATLPPDGDSKESSDVGAGMGRRKVSFADHLESVFVMEEMSSDPPTLHVKLPTIDDYSDIGKSDTVFEAPRLALNFTQPASDYMAFRNKVMSQFVSLENVIVRNYDVSGTIRVRNLSFQKSVVVRYTLNSWLTFTEVHALYQPSVVFEERFDTFLFQINCPSNLPAGSKLQFAVRYETDSGAEFWDSNEGENYEILYVANNSSQLSPHTAVFSLQPSDSAWTEYSGWSSVDAGSPYW